MLPVRHQCAKIGKPRVAFAVKPGKGPSRGHEALQNAAGEPERRLCCLRRVDAAVVVMGKEPVLAGGRVVGYVTNVGFGYSIGESLAYAYLPAALAHENRAVAVEYFGQPHPATVASEPCRDPQGERLRV